MNLTDAQQAGTSPEVQPDDDWTNPAEVALPEAKDLFFPATWQVILMPRRPPVKSAGGIILVDSYRSKEQWLNYIGQIVCMGPLAFKHSKFTTMGWTPEMTPKRGEFWAYKPYSPYRMEYQGIRFIALDDDSLIGRIPPGCDPNEYRAGI